MTVGEPPNHALISPSPTKSAARCEPSGSMTQTGWPLWTWPSPTLIINPHLNGYQSRTLLYTDEHHVPDVLLGWLYTTGSVVPTVPRDTPGTI